MTAPRRDGGGPRFRRSEPLLAGLSVLLSVLGCLCALEVGLRVYHFFKEPVEFRALPPVSERCIVPSRDPDLVFELQPGWRGRGFSVNALGMADDEVSVEKPPGTYRIAFVGDSLTCAFPTPPRREVYLKVLERALNARARDRARAECLNFGVNGYGLLQDLEMARSRVPRFSPDLVVAQLFLNDGYPSKTVYDPGPPDPALQTYALLLHMTRPARFGGYFVVDLALGEDGWRNIHAGMEGLAALTRGGPPVLAVLFPYLYEPAYASWGYAEHHRRFRDTAAATGLPFLDLHDAFSRGGLIAGAWPRDPIHPGPEGHRVAAGAILDELDRRGLFPEALREPSP